MLPFRKILFPVDYSDSCRAIVPHVKEVAALYEAQVCLVHAYGSESLPYDDLALIDPQIPLTVQTMEEGRMREFAAEAFPGVETFVRLGEPIDVIRDVIHREQSDLIMLPTHGRGFARRLLLGSVTTKVLHDVSAAVWTATPAALKRAPAPCATVLCACDLNYPPEAELVVRAAAAIAKRCGADLSLLHVIELPPFTMEVDYVSFRDALIDAAHSRLRELKAKLGMDAPHTVAEGGIASALYAEAVRTKAGLIVTGRGHEQERVSRLWSSLYEIVREAPCPVLSI